MTMLLLVLALLQAAGLGLGTTHLSYQGGQPGPSHRCHALPRPLRLSGDLLLQIRPLHPAGVQRRQHRLQSSVRLPQDRRGRALQPLLQRGGRGGRPRPGHRPLPVPRPPAGPRPHHPGLLHVAARLQLLGHCAGQCWTNLTSILIDIHNISLAEYSEKAV